ncbi:MAG: NAD(+)/NADH kinase [Lentisphaerae bacterium]|nr:NAD(+)/NADH kinase [Lentisphaerota bacterium]
MTIHFHANVMNPRAREALASLASRALSLGLDVVGEGAKADLMIALGGDGTILRAVRSHPELPVLGFNLGSLGYLATVGESEFDSALQSLAKGDFKLSGRAMLEARHANSPEKAFLALNEIVVMREMTGHAAAIDLEADGKHVTRYLADGLVVATPTGSTAYSLAAGGPILMPDSASLAVTPMNPHALGVRPLVVSDSVCLRVTSRRRVNGRAEKIGVYADGEGVFMLDGDESAVITLSSQRARFVELEGYDPYGVLGRKLGWCGVNKEWESRQENCDGHR